MTGFPSWRYGPDGEAQIFQTADDVPAGWVDHPAKFDPLDHDGDGRKGGSKPRVTRRGAGK
jgi:hypothetical protein